jgi:hypothetical protein
MNDKPVTPDRLKDRMRDKTIDERARGAKQQLAEHLEAVADVMNELSKDGIAVTFGVNRNEHGIFTVQNLTLTRTY